MKVFQSSILSIKSKNFNYFKNNDPEYKDTVSAAYEEEKRNEMKRALEKREAKIINNWAHLVKLLLIRERLKKKYDTKKSIMTKLADDYSNSKKNCEFKHIPIESIDIVGGKLNKPVEEKTKDDAKMDIDNNIESDNKFYEKIPMNSKKNTKGKSKSKASSTKKTSRKTKKESSDESDPEEDSEFEVQEKVKKRPIRKVNSRTRKVKKDIDIEQQNQENEIKQDTSKEIAKSSKNIIAQKQNLNQNDDLKLSESESE